MPTPVRYLVIGGGIIGLAVAERLCREHPGAQVTVVEKEAALGRPPDRPQQRGDPLRALLRRPARTRPSMCRAGSAVDGRLRRRRRASPTRSAASSSWRPATDELPGLARLQRARASPTASRSPGSTGDAGARARAARQRGRRPARPRDRDHRLRRGLRGPRATPRARRRAPCCSAPRCSGAVRSGGRRPSCAPPRGDLAADRVVACAGPALPTRSRAASATSPSARIIPFRGEYFELRPGGDPPRAQA